MKTGDKVQYSKKFLRSISCYTGKLPFAKGTIIEIKKYGGLEIAIINWNDPEIPEKVNIKNLSKIGGNQS